MQKNLIGKTIDGTSSIKNNIKKELKNQNSKNSFTNKKNSFILYANKTEIITVKQDLNQSNSKRQNILDSSLLKNLKIYVRLLLFSNLFKFIRKTKAT